VHYVHNSAYANAAVEQDLTSTAGSWLPAKWHHQWYLEMAAFFIALDRSSPVLCRSFIRPSVSFLIF